MSSLGTDAAGQGNTDSGAAGSGAAAATQGQATGGSVGGTDSSSQGAGQGGAQGAGGDAAGQAQQQGQQQSQQQGQQQSQQQGAGQQGQQAHWSESMPEGWREALKGFDNPEAAQKALQRGVDYKPATKPEDVKLTYPEGMTPDTAQADRFRALAIDAQLTPQQCQKLLDWQVKESADAYAAAKAAGEADLRAAWGNNYEANGQKAAQALTALDRRMNGELAPAIASIGGADNPVIIKALYTIGTLISEDTLAGASAAASAPDKPETPEDAYKGMFNTGAE